MTPLGRVAIARDGSDVTDHNGLHGPHDLQTANRIEKDLDLSAEVLDLQSLVPLDEDAILAAAARTGRVIIVESRDTCSVASHISAILADKGFSSLKAPVRRITVPDTAMPYAPSVELPLMPNLTASLMPSKTSSTR